MSFIYCFCPAQGRKKILTLGATLFVLCLSAPSFALETTASASASGSVETPAIVAPPVTFTSLWNDVSATVSTTWQSEHKELYVPLHTWHNRRMYTAEKIASYNENPWGIGLGKYRYDDAGNWHALYAMTFLDSHNKMEPIAGYGYQKMWRPSENWRLGAGFTAGFTARADYHYYPIPVILPLVSVEYGRFALQATYVPGGKGNGNILFSWLRWQF